MAGHTLELDRILLRAVPRHTSFVIAGIPWIRNAGAINLELEQLPRRDIKEMAKVAAAVVRVALVHQVNWLVTFLPAAAPRAPVCGCSLSSIFSSQAGAQQVSTIRIRRSCILVCDPNLSGRAGLHSAMAGPRIRTSVAYQRALDDSREARYPTFSGLFNHIAAAILFAPCHIIQVKDPLRVGVSDLDLEVCDVVHLVHHLVHNVGHVSGRLPNTLGKTGTT